MKRIVMPIVLLSLLIPLGIFVFCGRKSENTGARRMAEYYFEEMMVENKPVTKADGAPFQIAYVDIDPYPASGEMLYYLIEELQKKGWITDQTPLPFEPENTDARALIQYLSKRDLGEYMEFVPEAAYYLAIDGEEACRESLLTLLDEKKIDLILCMGTWPGTFVQSLQIEDVPVMVYFSVDPVGKRLAKNTQYSGKENRWCHVNDTVYNSQMQFYYDNIGFSKLGVVYYDETVGAMRAYRESAEKNGFQIEEVQIESLTGTDDAEKELYYEQLQEVFQKLVEKKIDCFVLGTDIIKDESRIKEQIQVFVDAGIPVVAQNGEYYVKEGALMMITASDALQQAPFVIDRMAAIFNGKKPGNLKQEFFTPPYLSINLETAEKIGYQVPEHLILSSEKLYSGGVK